MCSRALSRSLLGSVKWFYINLCVSESNIKYPQDWDTEIALSQTCCVPHNEYHNKIHIHVQITNHCNLSHLLLSSNISRGEYRAPLPHSTECSLWVEASQHVRTQSSFISRTSSSGLWGWWVRGHYLKYKQGNTAVPTAQQEISLFCLLLRHEFAKVRSEHAEFYLCQLLS